MATMNVSTSPYRQHRMWFLLFASAVFLYVFSHAWTADDAYITFRVVDNFIDGYGLRWNVDERVQAYTHPLWLLLHIPFYAVYQNIYFITIGLSTLLGVAAVALLLKANGGMTFRNAVLVVLPLGLSISFHEFIISGLEVPLTLALFSYFLFLYAQEKQQVLRLFFIASLIVLTRFDNVIPLAPFLGMLAFTHVRAVRLPSLILAWSPLLLWIVFSFVYYGFIFPNTKYAKLHTGIAFADYVRQGLHYIRIMFMYDMLGALWIVLALITGVQAWQKSESSLRLELRKLLGLSLVLTLLYVIAIGGDFMAGRLFVLPIFLSVWLFAQNEFKNAQLKLLLVMVVIVAAFQAAVFSPRFKNPPMLSNKELINYNYGIVSERAFYRERSWLFEKDAKRIRHSPLDKSERKFFAGISRGDRVVAFATDNVVGFYGYYAGPKVAVIDRLGLADPLLARLPVKNPKQWRIGHFWRPVPPGYETARKTGRLDEMDDHLAEYYEKLQIITQGDLWSMERFSTILDFQLGKFDYLISQAKDEA